MSVIEAAKPTVLAQHTPHPCQRKTGVTREHDIAFRLDPGQAREWRPREAEHCAMVVGSGIPGICIKAVTSLTNLSDPNYVEAVWEQDGRLFKGFVVGTDHSPDIPLRIISVNDAGRITELAAMIGNGVDLEIIGVTSSVRRSGHGSEKVYRGSSGQMTRGAVKGRGERDARHQFAELTEGARTAMDRTVPADITALGDEPSAEYLKRFDSMVATMRRTAAGKPPPKRPNTRPIRGRQYIA